MNSLFLSQLQFAVTTVYHFFFVPLTLGLSVLTAIMETLYVWKGDEVYKKMVKFWGKLFLINFAMGVVTGIVQEFQFGMNWSEYSRFVGDIFGAPLAVEALLAFFLESTFLGLWVFGWERISKKTHLLAIWLVAIGSNVSAFWILAANSFMQSPVGYALEGGRLVMTDFFSLITNPYVWGQFPHTVFSGLTTAAFFVIGISAFHLFRKQNLEVYNRSLKIAVIFGLIAIIGVIVFGDSQAKHLVTAQPMKLAAAEGLLKTENPASLNIFTIIDTNAQNEMMRVGVPNLLSFMAFNTFTGEVKGIQNLQEEYTQKYGPGNYIPNLFMSFYTFRFMVGLGFVMLGILVVLLGFIIRKQPLPSWKWLSFLFPWVISFPYIANSCGWLLTELGRQPWIVFGLMKTSEGVSVSVDAGEVLTTLILYTLVYGILMVADVYLLVKFAKAGPQENDSTLAEALNG
jgi:cytochrome bd ubiquinol oxidase subunit I